MKTIVCTLTMRLPLALLVKEGKTEEMVQAEFEALRDEMTESAPDGSEFSLSVTTEDS